MKRTLAALAATTLLTAGLAACGDATNDATGTSGTSGTSGSSGSSGSSTSRTHNDADLTFVRSMIPHHEQAVRMSEMADDAAASPEVRDLAKRIKAAQGPEIEKMRGWLEDWGAATSDDSDGDGHMHGDGTGADHGSGMPGMMSSRDLDELHGSRGAGFDRMFLTMMIAHHRGAIEMARTEVADGKDPEVMRLAADIESAQTAEIAEMRRLLRP